MPDAWEDRSAADTAAARESPAAHRVGWGFISLYTLAYISTSLLFLAPLLVTLALKVNSLVGIERAPDSLALVAGTGALLAMFGNPFFGKMSDRTSSRLGMRRPWMVIGLVAIGGLGFGVYVSVDLALVADVLPDKDSAAKDLGAFNIAGALPFSVAPAIAPVILAIGAGSYGVLYAVRSPRGEAGRARAGMCRFRHGTAPAVPRVKGCWRR